MSDKKQPAQQRVNVRIVKADDPEQRGGMKPIAKADGSLQISPEEACTAGIWTKPPFDLRGLSKMVDESTILPQCIRAYKSNIAGFGIDIRYKDDFADADETPEMKAEWDRAAEVVEMLNMEQESNELFEDIVEARETYGCAYAEVIRDMDGNVIQLEFIEDTPSVEKSRRLDPRVEVTYFHRDHTENRMRKFRKYKQTVNGKTVYYKEFGDPRIMDPTSGEYVTELEFKSRANEIIEFAIGTATYGKVRWVGSILTVDGARRAESLNNSVTISGLGEILVLQDRAAVEVSWDSFFPAAYFPGIQTPFMLSSPDAMMQRLFEWKISAKPVHLILTGTRVNFYAAIQSLQPYRKGGDPGSIYYKIKLKEYREVRIRQVKVSSTGTATVSGGSTRTDNRVQAKTYTVKPGDCLYNISKSTLGDGGRYKEIYSLNKDKLKNPNLIYPGQVLQLP